MRKKLTGILSAVALGCLSVPVWAQPTPQIMPEAKPLPPPTLVGQPAESPPPRVGNGIFPDMVAPTSVPEACCGAEQQQPQRSFWSGTWSVGGGAEYLFPFFSSNPAFFTKAAGGTNSQHDFGNGGSTAPLAFLGYTFDNGLGIQGRWFSFHDSSTASTGLNGTTGIADAGGTSLATPAAGSSANAHSELNMNVVDLEITQKWVFGCGWWIQLGAGARYAHIDQNYSLSVADKVLGNSTSTANHGLNGWGPTISFEVHRKLFDSDFGVYGTARGSLLFGTTTENYALQSTNALVTPASGTNTSSSIVPVGEVELGGEWSHCWGRLRVYGQLGVVGQIWGGAGNASTGVTLAPGSLGNQGSNPANFGFIGGVGRVGIDF